MDDAELDTEIVKLLHAYGAAAIPVEHIARAVCPSEDAVQRVKERLIYLANEGRVRQSRVFPDRWLGLPE